MSELNNGLHIRCVICFTEWTHNVDYTLYNYPLSDIVECIKELKCPKCLNDGILRFRSPGEIKFKEDRDNA